MHKQNNRNFGKSRKFYSNGRDKRHNQNSGRRDWQTTERLQEKDCHITQYISDTAGFTGIIKSRFSDFQVNEIDLQGDEAVLSDFKMPELKEDEEEKTTVDSEDNLSELITEDQLLKIKELMDGRDVNSFVQIDVTEYSKEKRTKLHKFLTERYGKKVFSNTVDDDDKKFIQVKKATKKDQKRSQGWQWPHEFTYFILHKENIDTLQAIAAIAQQTGVKPGSFVYAGTKDKRGKTSQWICVRKMEPLKICKAAKNTQGIRVGNFKFLPDPLKLGDLKGNRFRIALRSVSGEPEAMEKSLEIFRDIGFINYYGMQRFGNCIKVPTHVIGKALLQSDFEKACDLILHEREGEPPYMQKMRRCWAETRNAEEVAKCFHSTNTCVESRLIKGLIKNGGNNYLQALLNIPRNMLTLYLHSYQSLIWNEIASKRRELFGLKIAEGDLVFTEHENNNYEVIDDAPITEDETENVPAEAEESKFMAMVRPLTEEDLKSGKFTIYDIVLPLPGHDIKYPSNAIGDFYRELLEKDDLSGKLKNKHQILSLAGAYRKVFVKPENCTWKFMKYQDTQAPLIISDYEKMMKDAEPVNDPDGQNTALILDMTLPSSTYATMALREILKIDTSVGSQIQLENESKKNAEAPTEEPMPDEENSTKRPADDAITEEIVDAKKQKID